MGERWMWRLSDYEESSYVEGMVSSSRLVQRTISDGPYGSRTDEAHYGKPEFVPRLPTYARGVT